MAAPRWFQEFQEAHGSYKEDAVWVVDLPPADGVFDEPGWWVYPDGARHGELRDGGAAHIDPPGDEYELAAVMVCYHRARLAVAVDQHHEAYTNIKNYATRVMARGERICSDEELEEVANLKRVVEQRKRELKRAEATLEETTPDHVRQRRTREAAAAASTAEYNTRALKRLEKLRI